MLASDDNNPAFMGARNPDQALSVWFLSKPIQNPFRTAKEGRPIFEDVIYIHIESGGDKDTIIERPIYESDKVRFAQQWAAWDNAHGKDPQMVGTPLSAWPLVSASQAEELRGIKFRTIEQIAEASDAVVPKLTQIVGMAGHSFRERARAFLNAAQNAAVVENQAVALKAAEEQNAAMQAQLKALQDQVAQLTEIALAPEKKKRGMPKGGWPKKEVDGKPNAP